MEKKKYGGLPPAFVSCEQFVTLIRERCYYCDRLPEVAGGMGIDRIDNNLGHVEGNVVTCCRDCNFMRGDLAQEKFLDLCGYISANHPDMETYAIFK